MPRPAPNLTRHLMNTGYVADDHNAPALWITGGRLVCGLSGHNDSSSVKFARSSDTNPANMGAFTSVGSGGGITTYIQFLQIGAVLHAATRTGVDAWRVFANAAGGDPAAWGSSSALVTSGGQTYMAGRATGTGWR